jgi:hypothetical protein
MYGSRDHRAAPARPSGAVGGDRPRRAGRIRGGRRALGRRAPHGGADQPTSVHPRASWFLLTSIKFVCNHLKVTPLAPVLYSTSAQLEWD